MFFGAPYLPPVPHICRSQQMWESVPQWEQSVGVTPPVPHICRSQQMWE
jgi:hypothetical protein